MSVSVDGFIADREGAFGWTVRVKRHRGMSADRHRKVSVGGVLARPGAFWGLGVVGEVSLRSR
jgi:hypothetical protein